jgi:hypothetical protein
MVVGVGVGRSHQRGGVAVGADDDRSSVGPRLNAAGTERHRSSFPGPPLLDHSNARGQLAVSGRNPLLVVATSSLFRTPSEFYQRQKVAANVDQTFKKT